MSLTPLIVGEGTGVRSYKKNKGELLLPFIKSNKIYPAKSYFFASFFFVSAAFAGAGAGASVAFTSGFAGAAGV